MYGIGPLWSKMLFRSLTEWSGIMVSTPGFNMTYNSIIVNLKLFSKTGKSNNLTASTHKHWKNNKNRPTSEKVQVSAFQYSPGTWHAYRTLVHPRALACSRKYQALGHLQITGIPMPCRKAHPLVLQSLDLLLYMYYFLFSVIKHLYTPAHLISYTMISHKF